MSVYALNLLRGMVDLGHDVTMLAQYRDDPEGKGVYGGGPPDDVEGVKVIGMESKGEAESGDFERDIQAIVNRVVAEHEVEPFDIIHAQCVIYPREVIKRALAVGASGILLAHNHPAGTLKPSEADWNMTLRLHKIGKLLNIPLLDHIIICRDGVQGLRGMARWPPS